MKRILTLAAASAAMIGALCLTGCDVGAAKGTAPPKNVSAAPGGDPTSPPAPPPAQRVTPLK